MLMISFLPIEEVNRLPIIECFCIFVVVVFSIYLKIGLQATKVAIVYKITMASTNKLPK